jgi:hypothetical protein
MIVEDQNQDIIMLALYNQVPSDMKFDDIQKKFHKGLKIGVKQPYKKISMMG